MASLGGIDPFKLNKRHENVPAVPPFVDPSLRSDEPHASSIRADERYFRSSFLQATRDDPSKQPPPLISCSDFVPQELVAHLMRKKKSSAIGVKYEDGDEITNMEGALHTFITPILSRCEVYGDYKYAGMHTVDKFGVQRGPSGAGNVHTMRPVVLSASIQMDFENSEVLLAACRIGREEAIGRDLLADKTWTIPDTVAKQNKEFRNEYDRALRQHMVFHLTLMHKLPSADELAKRRNKYGVMNSEPVIELLENDTWWQVPPEENFIPMGSFLRLENGNVVSLEMLFFIALHQARNELDALELLCPQGYVYTYDPPSIFAQRIGAKILNRLMARAVRELHRMGHAWPNMRVFAFNDYLDKGIIKLLDSHIDPAKVVSKASLFQGPGGQKGLYDISHIPEAKGAMLVIHNNSDGFGQNIETEGMSSLDGALGVSSSAAAGLDRSRKDLLDHVWIRS